MWVPVEERGESRGYGVSELLGRHRYQIDAKGRISLPAKLRAGFADGVFVTLGQDGCLYAFPLSEWERRRSEVEALAISDPRNRAYARMFFGNAEHVRLDKQGRLALPRTLRDEAGLGKDVTVVGVSDRLEIWAHEAYEKYRQSHEGAYASGSLVP